MFANRKGFLYDSLLNKRENPFRFATYIPFQEEGRQSLVGLALVTCAESQYEGGGGIPNRSFPVVGIRGGGGGCRRSDHRRNNLGEGGFALRRNTRLKRRERATHRALPPRTGSQARDRVGSPTLSALRIVGLEGKKGKGPRRNHFVFTKEARRDSRILGSPTEEKEGGNGKATRLASKKSSMYILSRGEERALNTQNRCGVLGGERVIPSSDGKPPLTPPPCWGRRGPSTTIFFDRCTETEARYWGGGKQVPRHFSDQFGEQRLCRCPV